MTCRRFANVIVAAPVGRVDHAGARVLGTVMEPAWSNPEVAGLILDFEHVEYISSAGLRVLMLAANHMRGRRARIGVNGLQPVVAEVFSISRFDAVLEVFRTLREALGGMSSEALAAYSGA